uniref:Uncharacterized protein n=2 Tax=Parascaris univalens TaxID=6257 RepID=A0A915CI01_PARUN
MWSLLLRALNRCCCCCCATRHKDSDSDEESEANAVVPCRPGVEINNIEKTPPAAVQRPFNWQLDLSTIFSESLDFPEDHYPPTTTTTTNVGSFLAPELTQMSTSPVDIEKILQRLELVATRLEAISAQKPTIAPKPSNRSVSSINSNGLYYIHCEITR